MPPPPKPYLTAAEYLALERQAQTRSEYLDGEVFAVPRESRRHEIVAGNVAGELRAQLDALPHRLCLSMPRIYVPRTGLYAYPDVGVVCGEPRFEDEHRDTLLNPTLLVEVFSPATEAYDRGRKFAHYRALGSLAEYLLVSPDEPQAEQLIRQDDGRWLYSAVSGLESTLLLPSVEAVLPLAAVYAGITFP